jgi:hypothetical protein
VADHIMQYFVYGHLPPAAQAVSKPFCELARWIENKVPRSPERTVGLRKLLEAKDAVVRASLLAPSLPPPPAADTSSAATRPTDPASKPPPPEG